MPEGFDVGSIYSALKIEVASLEKGLASGEAALDKFATKTGQTAENVDRAGKGISLSFDTLAKKSAAFATEFQSKWDRNRAAVESSATAIGAATGNLGTRFELINRQNARLAQEFQQRWKQNQAAVAGASTAINQGAQSFGVLDRNSLRATERFARLTNRLVGVQFAMQGLAGESNKGSKAIEVATKGIGIFASTAILFPGPVGLAVGALLGLGVAFKAATAAGKETVGILQSAKAAVEAFKTGQRERAFESLVGSRLQQLFPDQQDIQIVTKLADQIAIVRRNVAEQVRFEEEINTLHKRRAEINKTLEDPTLGLSVIEQIIPGIAEVKTRRLTVELESIDKQILQLQRNVVRVGEEGKKAAAALPGARLKESFTAAEKVTDEFREQTEQLELQAKFGNEIVEIERQLAAIAKLRGQAPGAVSATELPEKLAKLDKTRDILLERARTLFTTADAKAFQDLDKLHESLEQLITPTTALEEIEKAREKTIQRIIELKKAEAFITGATVTDEKLRKDAEERVKTQTEEMKLLARKSDFKDAFADPVSEGVFQGLADGILHAGDSFKPLVAIGENLFSNMVNSFASQLQKQLSSALTSALGAGGTAFANLLTGIAGIVGFFMSRKKSDLGQTFSDLNPAIESSQLVRGVVAGPSSVPIAAVGEDLQRALVPTNNLLGEILYSIRRWGRGTSSSPAAGGFQFAGTAPTS
jgi:hypothetical protein